MDRRRYERFEMESALHFSWESPRGVWRCEEGVVRNMSPEGIFVSTAHPPAEGSHVRFQIGFDSPRDASRVIMHTTAEVVRVISESEPGGGFAAVLKKYSLHTEETAEGEE